jgi:hypothetical protein
MRKRLMTGFATLLAAAVVALSGVMAQPASADPPPGNVNPAPPGNTSPLPPPGRFVPPGFGSLMIDSVHLFGFGSVLVHVRFTCPRLVRGARLVVFVSQPHFIGTVNGTSSSPVSCFFGGPQARWIVVTPSNRFPFPGTGGFTRGAASETGRLDCFPAGACIGQHALTYLPIL